MQLTSQLISRSLSMLPAMQLESLFGEKGAAMTIAAQGEEAARKLLDRATEEVE